jgi:hypothetical protein
MSERNDYPAGVPCWVTNVVRDLPAARAFYEGVFGWTTEGDEPGDSAAYAVARLRGRDVAGLAADDVSRGWSTEVAVDDLPAAVSRAVEAGGTVLKPPADLSPIGRLAVLSDPSGAAFGLWEPGDRRGAQLVNESSAWALSALRCPDPEGAIAFYGAVFGWEPEAFGAATMCRLPGYFGGVATQPVSRDVVAVVVPSADPTPVWRVTFWIDDTDAAVSRAAALGGSVVVPPDDAPGGFRQALLADPEGGTFSVSEFAV